jgi:hypothetical protein
MTQQNYGAFYSLYTQYHALGFSVTPTKGKRAFVDEWSQYSHKLAPIEYLDQLATENPLADLGLCCGKQSRVVAFDLDLDVSNPKQKFVYDAIEPFLPKSPVEKRGKKGATGFFKYNGETNRSIRLGKKTIIDILSDGKQTVLPPSMHPETLKPYVWCGEVELLECSVEKLPYLDTNCIKNIEEVLSKLDPNLLAEESFGRNNALVSQAMAAIGKGKSDDEIIIELIQYDRSHHTLPLFTDQKDSQMRKRTEGENATRFVKSVRKSTVNSNYKNGDSTHDFGPSNILQKKEINWEKKLPLPSLEVEAPTLPEEMVPLPIRKWVVDAARRLQVPIEFIIAPLLGTFASVVGRKIGICPKRYDSWSVIPVLWVALVARPAKKKSPAMEQALRPLNFLEEKAYQEYLNKLPEHKAAQEVQKAKLDAIKAEIHVAVKEKLNSNILCQHQADLANAEREAMENRFSEKRYSTNDITIEKLALLINENPNGLLVKRDELYGFLKGLEKQGHEGDREFYLEAANGKGRISIDRVGRGTTHLDAIRIGIVGGIQPGKLSSYIYEATRGGCGDDGLLQRFNFLIYPDNKAFDLPYFDSCEDYDGFKKILQIFEKIDALDAQAIGALQTEHEKTPFLRYTNEGQALFDTWIQDLELKLRADYLEPQLEAHLGKYRSLMPGLSLVFHLIHIVCGEAPGPVSFEAAKLSAMWCDFLEKHAEKVYSIITKSDLHSAHALARRIVKGDVTDGDTVREVYRHHWTLLDSQADVEAALSILEKSNWIRLESVRVKGYGPPAEVIRLHPELKKGDVHEAV